MKSSGSERLQDHQRDDERDECDSPEYVVIRVQQLQNSVERD